MTKQELELQGFINHNYVSELSKTWNRSAEELDEACNRFLARRLAIVTVEDADDMF